MLVFCFFNFRKKAKCFAGDVGSVGIAIILLFALGKLILHTGDFTYIIFFGVYGVDSVLTIFHRMMLHENLGKAHRKHAYQLMANELRIPHVVVSLLYMAMQLAVSFGLILLPGSYASTGLNAVSNDGCGMCWHWIYFAVVLLVMCTAYVLFMRKNYRLHEEYLKREGK